MVEKLALGPFLIKQNWAYQQLDQQFEIPYSLFWLYAQVKDYQNILKLTCWPLAFTQGVNFLPFVIYSYCEVRKLFV